MQLQHAVLPCSVLKFVNIIAYSYIYTDVPGGHRGLSRRSNHYNERTKCLNHFATFYGGRLPLHYSSVRIHRA